MNYETTYEKLTKYPKVLNLLLPYMQEKEDGYYLNSETLKSIGISIAQEQGNLVQLFKIMQSSDYHTYEQIIFKK